MGGVGSDPFGGEDAERQHDAIKDAKYLVREGVSLNLGQREEGLVVQYLALGGYRHFIPGTSDLSSSRRPTYIASGLHAGAGRLVFGWSERQYTDLALVFVADERDSCSRVYYHNHHGAHWHYDGHEKECPKFSGYFRENKLSFYMDRFRKMLASVFTSVRPDKFEVRYSTTTSCQLVHKTTIPSTGSDPIFYATLTEALETEHVSDCWIPLKATLLDRKIVAEKIRDGSMTGFVTLIGGRETEVDNDTVASANFGFCVQNYAVASNEVSSFTKKQITQFSDGRSVQDYLASQPKRTVNSGTFHSEETVSTTYLRWLMQERGFVDFEITHLMLYKFADWSSDFLKPVLQARHDYKRAGNSVAAECLKLIGNGSFGYNGLESSNYTTLRLMTDETVRRKRTTTLRAVEIQHLTMLGIVRVEIKESKNKKKTKKTKQEKGERGQVAQYFVDEASVADDDDDDDDDEEEEEEDDDDDADLEIDENAELERVLGLGEPEKKNKKRYKLAFLYALEVSGSSRKIFNNIAKAVAILSNSKKLFLSHVNVMMQCLDPKLAELCYMDTDSCIWSQTYPMLEDCILPEKRDLWTSSAVLADEEGEESCHGKMKLEGVFSGGRFKTMKIYRLYKESDSAAYTRCKGINRVIGERLPETCFDPFALDNFSVHRSSLRPTKTGEIIVAHENRHLAIPFNLKRYVMEDGIHTLPFSACLP